MAAFSVEWLHTGKFPSIDSWGNEIDSVGLSGLVMRLGYGLQLLKTDLFDVGAGISFGFVNQSMLSLTGSFVPKADNKPTVDIGVHSKISLHQPSLDKILGESFNAALLLQNVDFSKGTSSLPIHFQFGLGGQLYSLVNFDLDFSWFKGSTLVPGLGLEYWLKDLLAFRLGFKYDRDNPSMLSAGVGFKKQIGDYWIYLDYGTQFLGEVSAFPPMNISLKFDISKIEIKDKTDMYYYKGVDFFVHNNYKDAIAMWQKVLAKNPDHAEAKKRIGEAQRIMKLEEEQKKLQNLEQNFQQLKEQQKLNETTDGTTGTTDTAAPVKKAPATGGQKTK